MIGVDTGAPGLTPTPVLIAITDVDTASATTNIEVTRNGGIESRADDDVTDGAADSQLHVEDHLGGGVIPTTLPTCADPSCST